MPTKKGKDGKGGKSAKKKKSATDGTNAAVCKKLLKMYQLKSEEGYATVFPSVTHEVAKCTEEDKLITQLILENIETPASVPPKALPSQTEVVTTATAKEQPPAKQPVSNALEDVERMVTIQPLLDAIKECRYRYLLKFSMLGVNLNNADAASMAIFLKTEFASILKHLELVRAGISGWAYPRLFQPIANCSLTTLILDHNPISAVCVSELCDALLGNLTITTLSLNYCQIRSESGSHLGKMVASNCIQNLLLAGNQLQCQGVVELVTPAVELSQKGERMPNLSKLHLMDNGIDQHSSAGPMGPVVCAKAIKKLLLLDPLIQEINLDTNLIGETAALEILEGLKSRKETGFQATVVIVTHRITHDTFKEIMEISQLLSKKKRKGKKGGKKKKK